MNLGAASLDLEMVAEIRALLRKHRVRFLRDRDSLAPSKPSPDTSAAWRITPSSAATDHPGLVPIYKGADTRHPQCESAWHCDAPWRDCPPMGAALRCVECPPAGSDMTRVIMVEAYARLPEFIQARIAPLRPRHSIEARFGAVLPIARSGWR